MNRPYLPSQRDYGLCECGCGEPTRPAPYTFAARGWVKGEPIRFVRGHQTRAHLDKNFVVDPDTGCWLWQGSLVQGSGYGRLCRDGVSWPAHRYFFVRANGPIPDGLVLDHLCRVRHCVNPAHLEPVTHAENCRRGKQAKLTRDDAVEIRASSAPTSALATVFGVSVSQVDRIRRFENWTQEKAA